MSVAREESPKPTRDVVLAIRCRACGKVHRVIRHPADRTGRSLREFLFNCIRCGRSEIRASEDIFAMQKPPRTAAGRKTFD